MAVNKEMSRLAHYRIFGYVVTLILHIGNTIACKLGLTEEALKDVEVKNMAALENSYFTVWNIGFQILYAAFGIYCDLKLLKNDRNQRLTKCIEYRSYFFGTVLWPSALFIITIFWPIFIYDRNLIFPEFIDGVFPKFANYIMHAAVFPIVLWEMVFLPRNVPKSHKKSLIAINLVFFIYLGWILRTNATTGLWPYPMLYLFERTIYFYLFFLLVHVLLHTHYYIQWKLVKCLWGGQDRKDS